MDIRPFRGWRYRGAEAPGVADALLAPPYDVLSADDKRRLLARSERNIVAVDLPHCPPKEAGPDEEYRAAAELLARWQAQGVLVREDRPAVYCYEQTHTWAGATHTRTALICGVRATEFGEDVYPHERTHSGPKADRLKLTEHTRTQISPIFGFYQDQDGRVSELVRAHTGQEPVVRASLDGVDQALWAITDDGAIEAVATALRDRPAFIADGHHRYTTALRYGDALRQGGHIDEEHPANFVMFALVADTDPGLLILPTHRIVGDLGEDFTVDRLIAAADDFTWRRCDDDEIDLTDADAALRGFGPGAMAVVGAGSDAVWIARPVGPEAMRRAAPDKSAAWRGLDVAVLHELLLGRALAPWRGEGELAVEYTPRAAEVLDACRGGRAPLGICLRATGLSAVRDVALADEVMPHKSTYFFPKLATGTVLMPLE